MSDTDQVSLPTPTEAWPKIVAGGVPEVQRRATEALRLRESYEELELAAIASDPLFAQSCLEGFSAGKKAYEKRRRLPTKLVVKFNRPGRKKAQPDTAEKPED